MKSSHHYSEWKDDSQNGLIHCNCPKRKINKASSFVCIFAEDSYFNTGTKMMSAHTYKARSKTSISGTVHGHVLYWAIDLTVIDLTVMKGGRRHIRSPTQEHLGTYNTPHK